MGLRRLITEFLWPPSSSIIRPWLDKLSNSNRLRVDHYSVKTINRAISQQISARVRRGVALQRPLPSLGANRALESSCLLNYIDSALLPLVLVPYRRLSSIWI
ncbi:hypothetical protein EVAR_31807_1 [Eumeta japonica]|uniref:Uncharacterized protein n=1 Tax=Eumeta variegata TaxID=151549 RepID=A0A4C1W4S3_EUMVA|nr:hypothetical protein EVAR_31807_1 [Eumeta japonica]